MNQPDPASLANCARAKPDSAELRRSNSVTQHFTDNFARFPPKSQQKGLEARVGIDQFPPRLQRHYARFYWLLKHNPFNLSIPFLTPLVSVLVSAVYIGLGQSGVPNWFKP
jgi:hypothetical protein